VIQYIGEIFSIKSAEGAKRMSQCSQSTCTYLMKLSSKELIDPTVKGNIARFINHSCEPNCETQKWRVNGETRIGIFAVQNIAPNTELTFDYQWERVGGLKQKCYCGAPSCRGYLGAEKNAAEKKKKRRAAEADDEDEEEHEDHAFDIVQRDYCRSLLQLARLPLLMDAGGGDVTLERAYTQLVCEAANQAYDAKVRTQAAEARADLDAWRAELRAGARARLFLRRNVGVVLATRVLAVDRLLTGLSVVRVSDLRRPRAELQTGLMWTRLLSARSSQ